MHIEEIFSKQLTRDINGVVKAEQVDNDNAYVELEEYVITNELYKHMRNFFETYTPVAKGHDISLASKIGVWVSGFFGSGKSHFIKILSYLLENREVQHEGVSKCALDFFKEKIEDPTLYADISVATQRPTDVILFNIDSQASTEDGDNAILKVFLKVFNARIGYCADFPHVAHLERELDKRGQYATFKDKFAELTDAQWVDQRDAYDFYRDEMIEALAFATGQSEDSTIKWVDQLEKNINLTIDNFSKWVKDYLDSHGERNLLFMVDEVGQFIGKNTQMMLQLQTITENLGVACNGRAWVIVTSQADIDAAIGQLSSASAQDFSKIQGRFFTRLQLSSSNTNEVIQRRLLEKTEPAREELSALYTKNSDILRNHLSFDQTTTASLNTYEDNASFIDNYPFVPYHYLLVQKVFERIRSIGATGKHLAMGERSLLDAFQSAAKQVKDEPLGCLIPFYRFYAPIDGFLEPAVKRTIEQAEEKETLSPFDNKILKTLFLIRYVDVIKSTIDNLVTLSIDKIDADKITLKKQIEESLNRLEREVLIARNGDEYLFLTNEEKEIENEIRHTRIESSDSTNALAKIIFEHILKNKNDYRYPENKQDFRISRFCNDHPKDGPNLEDIVLKVVSPLDPAYMSLSESKCIFQSSQTPGCILVKLGDDKKLWDELTTYIKTERFLRINSGQRPEQEKHLREKAQENSEREKRLQQKFAELFCNAEIFAIGEQLDPHGSTPQAILDEACRYVIDNSFSKLRLLKPFSGEIKRELVAVLNADDTSQLELDLEHEEYNPEATREVEQFIGLKNERNEPVYIKDILQRFIHRPYGWHDEEIILLLARMALAGKVSFSQNHKTIPLKSAQEILSSARKRADVRVQPVRQHNDAQLRKASSLVKALFEEKVSNSNEKEIALAARKGLNLWHSNLQKFKDRASTGKFPGKKEIEDGMLLTAGILSEQTNYEFLDAFVHKEEELEDFFETYEDLDGFYSRQINVWLQLEKALKQFEPNRHIIEEDENAQKALQELDKIYADPAPYAYLNKVVPLIDKVEGVNDSIVNQKRTEAITAIDKLIESLEEQIDTLPNNLKNQALYPIQQCKKRINETKSLHQINSERQEASELEDKAISILNDYVDQQQKSIPATAEQNTKPHADPVASPIPSVSNMNMGDDQGKAVLGNQIVAESTPRKVATVATADILRQTKKDNYLDSIEDVESYLAMLRDKLTALVSEGKRIRIK
jgi:hypothetical protein